MSKYSRLGKNTFLVFVGSVGSKLISFIMLPFYTRWLSREDYGISDIMNVYVVIIMSIATCCLADAIFVFPKNQTEEKQKKYFTTGFLCSFIGIFLTGIIFFLHSKWSNGSDTVFNNYSLYIYLFMVVLFVQTYFQQFTRSIDKMNVYVLAGVFSTCLSIVFSFILIPKHGLMGLIWTQITVGILICIYSFIHGKLYKYCSIKAFRLFSAKEMLKYTIPVIPNTTMWWLINSSNRFFIEKYRGLEEIGIFAVANKFPSLIVMLYSIFFTSWQISVLDEYEKEGYARFYNQVARVFFLIMVFAVIAVSASAYWLTYFFVDAKFLESWIYIPVIALTIPFSSMSGFVGTNFMAVKKTKYFFYSSIWGAAVCLIFNFIAVPVWGLMGAAIGAVLSHIVMLIYRIKFAEQYVIMTDKMKYIAASIVLTLTVVAIPIEFNSFVKILVCIFLTSIILFLNADILRIVPILIMKLKNKL
jgi:O-antigen/teichoic acid export membrane protein